MKRLYTFSILSFSALAALSQFSTKKTTLHNVKDLSMLEAKTKHSIADFQKGLTSFWTNNFDTPADWTLSNTSTPSSDWVVGSAAPSGSFSNGMGPISSTSGGNFALYDSDALGTSENDVQNASIQYAGSIDCSGKTNIFINFESYYRHYQYPSDHPSHNNPGTPILEVSNDGGSTWAFVDSTFHADVDPNDQTENPELVSINISSVADNQSNVTIRFRYKGTWDYAWMIDDVQIGELSGTNGAVEALRFTPYETTAISQLAANYQLNSVVSNVAADAFQALTTVSVSDAQVQGSTPFFTAQGSSANLATFGAVDTVQTTTDLAGSTFNAAGVFLIDHGITVAGTDEDLSNNNDTLVWEVSDSLHGVSRFSQTWSILNDFSYAQFVSVENQADLTSLAGFFYFPPNSVGSQAQMNLYDVDPTSGLPTNIVASSEVLTITAADTGANTVAFPGFSIPRFYDFRLNTPSVSLPAGDYWIVFDDLSSSATLSPGFDLFREGGSSIGVDLNDATDQWGFFQYDLSFFLGFGTPNPEDPGVSNQLIENVSKFNVFPNPTSDFANIQVQLESAKNIQLQVMTATGSIVAASNFSSSVVNTTLDVSNLAKGIYFVKLITDKGAVVRRMTVK